MFSEQAQRILRTSFLLIFFILTSTVSHADILECTRKTFNTHFQKITIDTDTNTVSIVSFPRSIFTAELTHIESNNRDNIYYIKATRVVEDISAVSVDERGKEYLVYYRISPFINAEISSVSGASFRKIGDKLILDIVWDRNMDIKCARR